MYLKEKNLGKCSTQGIFVQYVDGRGLCKVVMQGIAALRQSLAETNKP